MNEDAEELDEAQREWFHSIVMKLAFIAKRGRPDLETALGFLRKRVSKCNVQDMEKHKRVLEFVRENLEDIMYLGAKD